MRDSIIREFASSVPGARTPKLSRLTWLLHLFFKDHESVPLRSPLKKDCQDFNMNNKSDGEIVGKVSATAPVKSSIKLKVNGAEKQLEIAPWTTLLDLLREQLDLTGTKKGCDHGQCGACTVLVDGKRINSCLTFAIMKDGAEVRTIEGLAADGALHPLQQAFIDHDAFQCGYCTPGQICSALGLMNEGRAKTADDIRELMSGNICRCGAYPNIVAAIRQAAQGSVMEKRRANGQTRKGRAK
jgi:xanthine dehydrogenase YagT iron-sulfur-binding subunit